MTRDEVIDQVLSFIDEGADPDDLLETTASVDSTHLYEAAVTAFGSWDAMLAEALFRSRADLQDALSDDDGPGRRRTAIVSGPRPDRVVSPDAHQRLLAVGRSGHVFDLDLDDIRTSATPTWRGMVDGRDDRHRVERFCLAGHDSGTALITTVGQGVAIDARLLPNWASEDPLIAIDRRFGGLADDEVLATGFSRRALRDADRLYSLSIFGQVKASDASEYARLSTDAIVATLLRDEDALFDVFPGPNRCQIFVASSAAKAIVFHTNDVRSQGRRATGVKAIGLDAGARVVGAFVVAPDDWVVLATELGQFKRMPLAEFRAQGRGGGGLQTCRLSPGDQVASMSPVTLDGDLLALTDRGRVARFPAYDVPEGSRAARGEAILEPEDGERIVQVLGVPAGNWLDS